MDALFCTMKRAQTGASTKDVATLGSVDQSWESSQPNMQLSVHFDYEKGPIGCL